MTEILTRPEHATERAIARRLRAKVTAAGGCAYCLHAVHGWGVSACGTAGRTFPLCLKDKASPQFEPDHALLKGASDGARNDS